MKRLFEHIEFMDSHEGDLPCPCCRPDRQSDQRVIRRMISLGLLLKEYQAEAHKRGI